MEKKTDVDAISKQVRRDILRMSHRAKSAHVGGAMSAVEILVTLYFRIMNVYPNDPYNGKRDRLFFSKAHDAKVLFSVLCRRGFFDEKILEGYELNDGLLPGHSTRHCVPGIEISAGGLGHGLPMAAGSALAAKLDQKTQRIFAVLSDGECDEGTTWEAALFASHHKLDNLTVIVDYNKLQGFGYTKDVLNLEPFAEKWTSFGWTVREANGNDCAALEKVLNQLPYEENKPSILLAHTVKGLGGVAKHINQVSSQYKPPTDEELEVVLKELE